MRPGAVLIALAVVFGVFAGRASADQVRMKNGDRLTGTVVRMEEGKLVFKTSYAGEITVKWSEVAGLVTDGPIEVLFEDKTSVKGKAALDGEGRMRLTTERAEETAAFSPGDIAAINPEAEPWVTFHGHLYAGASVTSGNTSTETYHVDGEGVARTRRHRFTLGGDHNRAKDDDEETADNWLVYGKYDLFLTEKFYLYTNGSLKRDPFADLRLRSTAGGGPGYQFFEGKSLNLSVEAGASWVKEDYIEAKDDDYAAGRWAADFDAFLVPGVLQIFHYHEGLVGLEDLGDHEDFIFRSQTGAKVPIYRGLTASFQFNWEWNETPPPDKGRTDRAYLFKLGYEF